MDRVSNQDLQHDIETPVDNNGMEEEERKRYRSRLAQMEAGERVRKYKRKQKKEERKKLRSASLIRRNQELDYKTNDEFVF